MKHLSQQMAAFLLILALLLSLAACGEKDSPNTSGTVLQPGSDAGTDTRIHTESYTQTDSGDETQTAYNGLFDDTVVHTVDVTISEEDWKDLLENPLEKTKYKTTVVIDGETLEEVSFATKGNTSLSSIASDPDSDRYSFKLNFGKYNKGQSYHGLDKLNLNNLYADATCLKDWLCYRIFRQAGVDAPLTSYVWLRVNGQDQGLYLAIEEIGESWLDRTQEGEGMLYKPETEEQNPPEGFGNRETGAESKNHTENPPVGEADSRQGEENGNQNGQSGFPGNPPQGFPGNGANQGSFPGNPPDGFPGGGEAQGGFPGGMGFGNNAKGADLKYTDNDPESYSDIFDNNETDMDEGAEGRVITALKALSEGKPSEALDTDELIRYFAAHNFVLNYDSYTGTMLHNYYLYEKDGKLSMLPWDYNLAFGGFGGGMGEGFGVMGEGMPNPGNMGSSGKTTDPGSMPNSGEMPSPVGMGEGMPAFGEMGGSDATSLVNTGIDSPLSGATEDSRPMWAWVAKDETYLAEYHAAYDKLLRSYFENGDFEAELDRMVALLRPYVEKDPTAFFTLEEFDTASATLKQFCMLRSESIRKQLDGSLATRTQEQDQSARVDASDIEIRAMGSMGGRKETQKRDMPDGGRDRRP